MTITNDLWPNFEDVPAIKSPRAIMLEQANFLSSKTKNLVTAEIRSLNTTDGRLGYRFKIIAPLLKDYSFALFSLYHGAMYYPCDIKFKQLMWTIHSEDELINKLRYIFMDEETKKVISSLLGQSKEMEGN